MSNTGRHRTIPDDDDLRWWERVPVLAWLVLAGVIGGLLAGGGYALTSFLDAPPGNPAYTSPNPSPSATMTIPPAPPVPTDPGPVPPATYAVAKGDTLWSVAVKHCGKGTDDGALYRANRAVIGPHPEAIRPGMTLRIAC